MHLPLMTTRPGACRSLSPNTSGHPFSFSRVLRGACLLMIMLGWVRFASAQVVLNEIMYRPGIGYPEPTALEFIELYNPSTQAVDVSGWALTSGVSFTFPAGTAIPAGSYVVIGADPV